MTYYRYTYVCVCRISMYLASVSDKQCLDEIPGGPRTRQPCRIWPCVNAIWTSSSQVYPNSKFVFTIPSQDQQKLRLPDYAELWTTGLQ